MYNFVTPAAMFRELISDRLNIDISLIFVSDMPPDPDFCVCCYDVATGGEQNDRLGLDENKIQIKVRDLSYNAAYSTLRGIKKSIQSIPPFTLADGSGLVGIWVVGSIAQMGRDNQNRALLTLTFRIITAPIQSGNRQLSVTMSVSLPEPTTPVLTTNTLDFMDSIFPADFTINSAGLETETLDLMETIFPMEFNLNNL